MKPLVKVILFGLLAAALALGCRWVWQEAGVVMDSGSTTWYEDAMLEAREMFLGKPDAIQELTALLVEEPPEEFLRCADGSFRMARGDALSDIPDEIAEKLPAAVSDYENGGEVLNIAVTDDAVIFYTYYGNGGCAGFLYEMELDGTHYFDYVELVENWKLFYHIPA